MAQKRPTIGRKGQRKRPVPKNRPWLLPARHLASTLLTLLPAVVHSVHEAAGCRSGLGASCPTARRGLRLTGGSESDDDAGEHNGEADHADDEKAEVDTGDENTDADDHENNAEGDASVVGATTRAAHRRDEIRIVLVEIALHLVEES